MFIIKMINQKVNVIFIALCLALVQSVKIKLETQPDIDDSIEYLINGDFSEPSVSSWSLFPTIPGWASAPGGTPIEIGRGNIYNSVWGSSQIVELDSHSSDRKGNYEMTQTVKFTLSLKCLLTFQYAARKGWEFSSGIRVKFNDTKLLEKTESQNSSLNNASYLVDVHEGDNIISVTWS
jgi:hypothetical protein